MSASSGQVRGLALLAAAGVLGGALLCAAVFVRVTLAWSDARPYEGEVTEIRYMVFAGIALLIAAAGAAGAVLTYRRLRRGRSRRTR